MTFKPFIGFDNAFDENSTASISVASGGGTLTNKTDLNKIKNRSLQDKYIFNLSAAGNVEIILTDLNHNVDFGQYLCLMNLDFRLSASVTFEFYLNGTLQTHAVEVLIKKNIYIEYGNISAHRCYYFISELNFDEVRITLNGVNDPLTDYSLGNVYIGGLEYLSIKPNMKITSIDRSKTDESNGGQKYAQEGVISEVVNVETNPLPSYETFIESASIKYINQKVGTFKPVVFIPSSDEASTLYYGALTKPIEFTQIKAKEKSTGNWLWTAKFQIEEEL